MNTSIWVPWSIVCMLGVISIVLLLGKGGFLIAGYNLLPKERKQKYNEKRICRVVGCGTSVISVILGIAAGYQFEMPAVISWIIPWGLFGTIAAVAILAETIFRRKA